MHTLSVVLCLVRLQIRARLQYREALVLAWISQSFGYLGAYGAIWIIASRFEEIGGWSWPELALLLGFHILGYALGASLTFVQLRQVEDLVHLGNFDMLLVRPLSPWVYLTFSGINVEYGGHIVVGVSFVAWSLWATNAAWSPSFALLLISSVLSAAILTAAIMTIIGASALLVGRSRHMFTIYFSFWELSRYPVTIFPGAVQTMLFTVAPLAFMAYVPVSALLGKETLLGDWAAPLSILAGPFMAAVSCAFWTYCLKRYRGSGG
jgi:ABC-2 type transport system permease protein